MSAYRRVLLVLVLAMIPALAWAQTSVVMRGRASTQNATTTPLSSGATFTGTWEDSRDYANVTVTAFSDKASASGGLKCQWSSDAVNVDVEESYTISANVGQGLTNTSKARYFRVEYTNGGVTQTVFRLSTVYRNSGSADVEASGGGLTDTELRATPVPVSGTVTANAGTGTLAVSGPVTDTQIRATPLPVSGTITANVGTGTQPVSGTVTVTDGSGALNVIVDSGTTAATQSGTWTVQPGNTANTTAWKVDGSAVTQPVSGTVTANVGSGTQPVSGTFWQATQPVSGTFWQATQPVSGTFWQTTQPVSGTFWQATQPVSGTIACSNCGGAVTPLFRGRASTFRTLGRAGTTGQKLMSLHNATGSAVKVVIEKVIVDMWQTVIKAVTVAPPLVRIWKVTVLPTNGTALTKNKIGGSTTSSASVTVLGDASADGTGSGTTLTATLPAGTILSQQTAPRLITAAGYLPPGKLEFLEETDAEIELGPLEGIVVFLDYTLATQNPVTDMWVASVQWREE